MTPEQLDVIRKSLEGCDDTVEIKKSIRDLCDIIEALKTELADQKAYIEYIESILTWKRGG